MSIAGFIYKNAVRNKRRFFLTVLSVAVSLFLLVTLLVGLRELTEPPVGAGASLRIAVPSKVSLATDLPARQEPIIAGIPGVQTVTPMTFFGGKLNGEERFGVAQFGIRARKFREIFVEAEISDEAYEKWLASRRACIVGKDVAERNNIEVGDRITLEGTIYPVNLELDVVGIYTIKGASAADSIFFHHEYMDESLGDEGRVGMWWVMARSAELVPDVIEKINARFANTANEVRAETERAFQMGFISMLGSVQWIIGSVCSVVVFAIGLVTASTMSMAIRERFRELSILKALGFRRREITAFILAESFGLAALGALLGIGGAAALYSTDIMTQVTRGFFPVFQVTPQIAAIALLVACLLGIVSSLAPAAAMSRLSVVEGLRTLD